jgi:hypothetical protein
VLSCCLSLSLFALARLSPRQLHRRRQMLHQSKNHPKQQFQHRSFAV